MFNHSPTFFQAAAKVSGLGWQGTAALLDLYGLIEYRLSQGIQPSMYSLAQDRATKDEQIRAKAHTLQSLGWLSFVTVDREGTLWTLHGISLLDNPESGGSDVDVTPNLGTMPTRNPGPMPTRNLGTKDTRNLGVHKKNSKELQEGEKKRSTSSSPLKSKAVEEWNRLKLDGFKEISSISPSRDRSIKALGGYQVFIDQLPAFFAGARKNPFWSKKRGISFENIIGSGAIPKAHFQELAESGTPDLNANQHTPVSMGHPDFYKPSVSGTIIARSSAVFTSMEDRDKREAEAREFYTRQQEAKS